MAWAQGVDMSKSKGGKTRAAAAQAARREARFWAGSALAVAVWVFVALMFGGA